MILDFEIVFSTISDIISIMVHPKSFIFTSSPGPMFYPGRICVANFFFRPARLLVWRERGPKGCWWAKKNGNFHPGGCFRKYWYPKMDGLQWKTLLKWMIWGYHYFWKHPGHSRWFKPWPVDLNGWRSLLFLKHESPSKKRSHSQNCQDWFFFCVVF